MKKKRVNVSIWDERLLELDEIAESEGLTRSNAIEYLIAFYGTCKSEGMIPYRNCETTTSKLDKIEIFADCLQYDLEHAKDYSDYQAKRDAAFAKLHGYICGLR